MKAIALEFRHEPGNLAANGTDVILYLDGRWSAASREAAVYRKLAELRGSNPRASAYCKQLFVGYTTLGDYYTGPEPQVLMGDPEPPAWA